MFPRWLKSLWRRRRCLRRNKRKVDSDDKHISTTDYIERERHKPELGDFTLGEYTEKVLLYGFLMVTIKFQFCFVFRFPSAQ